VVEIGAPLKILSILLNTMYFNKMTLKYHVATFSLLSVLLEDNKLMIGIEPLKWKLCLAGNDVQFLTKATTTEVTCPYLLRLRTWQVSWTKQGKSNLYFNGKSPMKS